MRGRALASLAVCLLVLPFAAGCSSEPTLAVTPQSSAVTVGEPVTLTAHYSKGGMTGCMAGTTEVTAQTRWSVGGKSVSNPVRFDQPGDYTVDAYYDQSKAWVRVVVEEGEASGGDDAAKAEEQADPSTLERIFMSGNIAAVYNGGKPVSFTLTETRRVRSIATYHWNDAQGTSGGGTITLKSEGGKTIGAWKVTRTGEGQGGVPNAYWYVEIDVELEPGTYTIHDSDPGTWAQNDGTNGFGHAWVDAEKK